MKSSRQASIQTEGAVNNVLSLRRVVEGIMGILSGLCLSSLQLVFVFRGRAAAVHPRRSWLSRKAAMRRRPRVDGHSRRPSLSFR